MIVFSVIVKLRGSPNARSGWYSEAQQGMRRISASMAENMMRTPTGQQIAEVVYEAATDGKDQLRYVAGADAKAIYTMRLQLGDEAFRKAINQQFFRQERVASA